jgi:2-polyprenyl-3-methyl-5-hydroxy-6-metoxy-1,4-benzoquinol methylase
MDKAGKQYWDTVWNDSYTTATKNISSKSVGNYVYWSYHQLFQRLLGDPARWNNKRVLEVGCGNSDLLPYFAVQWGMQVSGIDYSEKGCSQAIEKLQINNVVPDIYCADLFHPPDILLESFDLVVSFGVVEHFDNTDEIFKALKRFLKPQGLLFTSAPNHCGLLGSIQKSLDVQIYDIHKIIDVCDLEKASQNTMLSTIEKGYFINFSFSANISDPGLLKTTINKLLQFTSAILWWADLYLLNIKSRRLYSAGIFHLAKKN